MFPWLLLEWLQISYKNNDFSKSSASPTCILCIWVVDVEILGWCCLTLWVQSVKISWSLMNVCSMYKYNCIDLNSLTLITITNHVSKLKILEPVCICTSYTCFNLQLLSYSCYCCQLQTILDCLIVLTGELLILRFWPDIDRYVFY